MWIIYNCQDSPYCPAYIVESEEEAIRACKKNPEFSYCYIG